MPTRIFPPEHKVEQAQVGQGHILVLAKSGDVYAWGQGSEGEIGTGVSINVHVPRLVMTSGKGVTDITVGRYHNACVTECGLVYSWGAGEHGQLGHGLERTELLPRLAETMIDCVAGQIACGEQHTAVLLRPWNAGHGRLRGLAISRRRRKANQAADGRNSSGPRHTRLLSIGPTVRTFVDLFEDEREWRNDDTLKDVEVKEKDKEVHVASKDVMVQETKAALSRALELGGSTQAADHEPEGAGTQHQVESTGTNAATDAFPSEDQGHGPPRPVSPVGKILSQVRLTWARRRINCQVRTGNEDEVGKELSEETERGRRAQRGCTTSR